MSELVFESVEELKAYLESVPEGVLVTVTVDEGRTADGNEN